jgi:hypothetical protein
LEVSNKDDVAMFDSSNGVGKQLDARSSITITPCRSLLQNIP